jgi:hypothetical protein
MSGQQRQAAELATILLNTKIHFKDIVMDATHILFMRIIIPQSRAMVARHIR